MYTRRSFWNRGVSEAVIIELRLWPSVIDPRAQYLTGNQVDRHVQNTMKYLLAHDGSLDHIQHVSNEVGWDIPALLLAVTIPNAFHHF